MPVVIKSDTFSHGDWLNMSKISQSLKDTENNHPSLLEDLLYLSEESKIQFDRFQPFAKAILSPVTIEAEIY